MEVVSLSNSHLYHSSSTAIYYYLVLRRCLKKFDSSLVYCSDFGVRFKTSEIRTLCKTFRNPHYHTTSQRILFSPIYKTRFFCWKYGGIYLKYIWILHFCCIFNKVTRFYVRFLRFNWFWKRCFEDRTRPKFASLYRYQTSNPIFEAILQHYYYLQFTISTQWPYTSYLTDTPNLGWYETFLEAVPLPCKTSKHEIYPPVVCVNGGIWWKTKQLFQHFSWSLKTIN